MKWLFPKYLEQIRTICRAKEVRAMLLEKQCNIAWLGISRSFVGIAAEIGVIQVLVTDETVCLIANNIEAARIYEEERIDEAFPLEIHTYPWYEPYRRDELVCLLSANSFISDCACEPEMLHLRIQLDAPQIALLTDLGADAAQVMTRAVKSVRRGMAEWEISAQIGKGCLELGMEPVVNLVAADGRILRYRHPLPTAKKAQELVMLVLGARRHGLYACITRFVAFEPLSKELIDKRNAVYEIENCAHQSSVEGAVLGDVFRDIVKTYEQTGFPDEWRMHHQGGICGYNSRECKADFNSTLVIKKGMCLAWNPSVSGFKSEDTILVQGKKQIVLTETPELAAVEIFYQGKSCIKPDIHIIK